MLKAKKGWICSNPKCPVIRIRNGVPWGGSQKIEREARPYVLAVDSF